MTDIIATVGPSLKDPLILKEMFHRGVKILRFNFPHFNHVTATEYINIIHDVEKEIGYKFRLLLDTAGPGIRIGDLEEPISYEKWEIFKMVNDLEKVDNPKTLYCDYKYFIQDVEEWSFVKIDSWNFDVKVIEVNTDHILVEAQNAAILTSKRHINLPGVHIRLPSLWESDIHDVIFAIKNRFDFIAMSFVRDWEDVIQLRKVLSENDWNNLKIISKIENYEAVNNLSDIIDNSDLIMVARWDLWTELPVEDIPSYQRVIITKTKRRKKKVIVATQMLESMIANPIPTRAEVSDIFYSVVQGTDYVMLSWETAIGKYPLRCIDVMNRVIQEANKHTMELS